MKKQILISLASFILSFPLSAQLKQGILAIGGSANEDGYSIVQSADGGYAMAGYTRTYGAGGWDMYVVKWDSAGNLKWSNAIGGTNTDRAYCLTNSTDGGYAVVGSTMSFGAGLEDVYVVKLDKSGNVKWTKTIGGGGTDVGHSIIQTTDGGYAITGSTASFRTGYSDVYAVKLDSLGNLKWTKTIGGMGNNNGNSIIQTRDGGYAIGGNTDTSGNTGRNDMYLVKLDATGNLKWTKTIGGVLDDGANSVIQTSDGGYTLAGTTNSFGAGGYDMYVVKLDSTGNLKWTKTIGGSGSEAATSLVHTPDGGYVVTGATTSFGAGQDDAYLIKLDSAGNLKWTNTVGGPNNEEGEAVILCADGGYAVGGTTSSISVGGDDFLFAKFDNSGNTCIPRTSGGTAGSGGAVGSGGITGSGGTTSSGGTAASGGTNTNYCNVVTGMENDILANKITVYPSPSTGVFTISLPDSPKNNIVEIYDARGQKVNRKSFISNYPVSVDLSNLPNGVYFYLVTDAAGKMIGKGKMVLQK